RTRRPRRVDAHGNRRAARRAAGDGQNADSGRPHQIARAVGRRGMMTAAHTDHEEREQGTLYVLGALSVEQRRAFEGHLASCQECVADMRWLLPAVAALAAAVPQIDPPPGLRSRVLSSTAPTHASSVRGSNVRTASTWMPWLAAAASFVAAVGLGIYTMQL